MFGLKKTKKRRRPNDKKIVTKKRLERQKKRYKPIANLKPNKKRPVANLSIVDKAISLVSADVAIDLGSTKVMIYIKGRGIVLNEPSYIARYANSKEVIAVGSKARKMLGRTPNDIEVIQPVRNGVIVDYVMTEYMLRYFLHHALPSSNMFKPRIIVSIPAGISSVEKRAVVEATLQAGARKVVLIEETLAAALGVGLDKAKSPVAMMLDIGGGTTDIAVISQTGIVVSESLRMGSDLFDEAIIYYLKKRKRLLIAKSTAESLKKDIGTVDRKSDYKEATVRGRDIVTGLPKEVIISSKDLQKALEESVHMIVEGVKSILEKTPPEMISEIINHGIIITGGGALIDGFSQILTRSLGVAAYLSDSPRYSVILGSGRALYEMNKLEDVLEELQ